MYAIAQLQKQNDALEKRVGALTDIVVELSKRISALERATPYMRPTINGQVSGPVVEVQS